MIRRLYNKTSYLIDNHVITLERLKNGYCGNPRYKAIITNLGTFKEWDSANAYIYTFSGSYCGDKEEAKKILEYHIKELSKE